MRHFGFRSGESALLTAEHVIRHLAMGVLVTVGATTERPATWQLSFEAWGAPGPYEGLQTLDASPADLAQRGIVTTVVAHGPKSIPQALSGLRGEPHPETMATAMDSPETRTRSDAAQSVTRAIDILELIAEGTISLPELTARVGLSKTTTYRLVSTLVQRGLVETSGRSGYRIGRRLHELGSAFAPRE